jgi:hypothetical protein
VRPEAAPTAARRRRTPRGPGLGPAVIAAIAGAISLGAGTARAHLLPAQQGTVNVVGAGVFTVVSVPASSLHGADDDHDGVIDVGELERHESELRAEIDRRLVILDGSTPAETVRVDLILSPQHDAAGGRADQIVALKHAQLGAPPRDLRVRCDLFGARDSERALTLTATRRSGAAAETEAFVLTPGATEHAFFPPAPPAPPRALPGALGGLPRSLLASSALFAIAAALASWSRARRSINPTS